MTLLDFAGSPHGGRQRHLPEWESQPHIAPATIIDHSIVGSGESAYRLFRDSSGLESHFIVCGAGDTVDGEIWQLMDTAREADANLDANAYAISIETGDQGDPDVQPWTLSQLRSLQWLHTELRRVHPTIPRRESRSCSDPAGLGYHTLHGAPSCWTPVAKSCPGTVRKRQWHEVLLPAFLTGTDLEDDMTDEQARQLDAIYRGLITTGTTTIDQTVDLAFARLRTVEANVAPTNAALSQLQAQVAELTQLVKGLVLGDLGDVDIRGEFAGVAHVTTPVPPAPVADVQTDAT